MTGRLILAIISTILEEVAIVVIAQWGLPEIGIRIPIPGLVAIMVVWLAYSVFTFRLGTRALKKTPVYNLPNMVGSKGEVVSTLAPQGMVRIKGELWIAKSASGVLEPGGEVIVIEQDRLKLIVQENNTDDDIESTNKLV